MTAQRAERGTRPWMGCVLRVEVGVLIVLVGSGEGRGEIRASLDGCLLAEVARDRTALPVPGDWVHLRKWPDGRVTALAPMRPEGELAPVIALRR